MKEDLLMDNSNKNNLKKPLIYVAAAFLIFIIGVIVFAVIQNSKKENSIVPTESKPQEIVPKPQDTTNFQPLKIEEETPKIDKNKLIEEENKVKNVAKTSDVKKTPEIKTKEFPEAKTKEPKKEEKPQEESKITTGKYYIQVAALLKHTEPNKKFLELIKKAGFEYTFYTTYITKNGEKIKVTKVLVGPFKTKEDALKALKIVKQKITQNAFVFRVK